LSAGAERAACTSYSGAVAERPACTTFLIVLFNARMTKGKGKKSKIKCSPPRMQCVRVYYPLVLARVLFECVNDKGNENKKLEVKAGLHCLSVVFVVEVIAVMASSC
jgi:hypothetical protein